MSIKESTKFAITNAAYLGDPEAAKRIALANGNREILKYAIETLETFASPAAENAANELRIALSGL